MKVNKYRTNSCGELRISDVGKNVVLSGWVNSIRKLGGIVFLTLRDHFGITQVLVHNEEMVAGITKESTVRVEGKVAERESKNPKMETGDIEVLASDIQVLGKCKNVLPFEISEAPKTKEELRFKYRYLDLRNPETHKILMKRAEILSFVRNKLTDMGFMEVQTPILTSSSPEGARDYIVPTINAPGEFYALPQAPQQFKQLLMVSGYDKYFQIAPCFRNEPARADRTPGEFYQIDMEMSFATQEDVFEVCEEFTTSLYDKFTTNSVCKAPFVRIPYQEAMEKYCSDKPDLRNPITMVGLEDVFKNTTFGAFKDRTVEGFAINSNNQPRSYYEKLQNLMLSEGAEGLAWVRVQEDGTLKGPIVKFITEKECNDLIAKTGAKIGDDIFVISDASPKKCYKLAGLLRTEVAEKLDIIDKSRIEFCWIVDFPMYEIDEETGKIGFSHNPFSMPQGGLKALQEKDPLEILAYQYDVVVNGVELSSGAVRNAEVETMLKAFEIAGYSAEDVEKKFGALYTAFQYGAPPHAGVAPGVDRIIMLLLDEPNIREVIAFPMNSKAQDLMMNAPSEVTEKQLREIHIKLR